jgi:hypothetical protein
MTAPGITVSTLNTPPPVTVDSPTAAWFVTGICSRGPIGKAIPVRSMADYQLKCGGRSGGASLYDALDLFFRDGGTLAWVSRVAGTAALPGTLALKDGATTPLTTLNVTANSPGVWGNGVTVQVLAGTALNSRILVIALNGVAVEQSPPLFSPADAVAWSAQSNYVTITDAGSATAAPNNLPAVAAAAPLAGGADDAASITEATWTAALTAFPSDLGPGQLSAPGRTTDAAHVALLAAATATNRTALMDALDTGNAATLISAAAAAIVGGDASRGALFAGWVTIPGAQSAGSSLPAPNRSAPPSALAAAKIAAADIKYQHPNVAAAGPQDGASSYALGVSQTFTDADRGSLNAAGVNVIRSISAVVQVYGFRSLSTDQQWVQLGWCRLRMAIQDEGQTIAAAVAEFATIDAKGHLLGQLNGHLQGMLQKYWQLGALYGANATDSFAVDTSAAVNTIATAQAGLVVAVISIKRSSFAEFTQINIVNVPLAQAL